MTQRKIVHLQTLRAIAASAVVATHALEYPVRRGTLGQEYEVLAWSLGWIGVATFFVISGLIMIRSASDDFGSEQKARRFIHRRLIRVVPLYWLATLPFAAAAIARGEEVTLSMIVRSLLFIPYAVPGQEATRPIVAQGWTLNFEILFYVLFTLALLFRRRMGLAILIGFFPIVILVRSAIWPLVPYSDPTTPLAFWSDPITLLFVIGVLIGLAEMRRVTWHQVRHPIAWTLLVFAATLAIFILGGGSFPMPIWWQGLFALGAALSVILCTSAGGHRFPKMGRVAEAAGDASYSTYLLHPLLLMVLAAAWDRLPLSAQSPVLFVVVALPLCNLAGYASFRLVERPLTRSLSALTGRRPPLPAAAL